MTSVQHNRARRRSGLRIRGTRGHRETRNAILRFARWLRTQVDFPVRVPVYLLPGAAFRTIHGERVVASFFAPTRRGDEPYIRLATGDYPALKTARGRDDALAAILFSFARQVGRYQNWLVTKSLSDKGIGNRARTMLKQYMRTTDHP